jgi:hypothetical protein
MGPHRPCPSTQYIIYTDGCTHPNVGDNNGRSPRLLLLGLHYAQPHYWQVWWGQAGRPRARGVAGF